MPDKFTEEFVNKLSLPVIAAPMFLVSSPDLVIEACRSGIIGSFPLLNARTSEILEEWMVRITGELKSADNAAPWAVNIIVHKSNKRYKQDLELIKKYQPPVVITSLGHPGEVVEIVHQYGGLVFSDVIHLVHARKAAQTGVDGLILVCNGAGGHAGTINPIAFTGAVKEFWEGFTILAGCINNGQDILAAEALGADLVYMGTRFIASEESFASSEYKTMLIDSSFEDLIYTDAFSGVNANYLTPSIRNAGLDPEQLKRKEQVDVSHLDASEAKAWKDIWSAGQGVNSIKKVAPVKDIVEELKRDYDRSLERLVKKNEKANSMQ
ncbi:NAD(P)H-dependent flavin oxidoreductase [Fictibacillus fluitans]|uniref:Probable nitronate monooxygenase n=1 Tax=Fictibacillus fluitans TaxID=3058422 RepID=A0ABT8HYE6_9BACL|nr:nitronate monooxygenase [Fictibacillus sp. NE201]MDN4525802.1 nitronate monooxygenase [Fictibacillus sp. NE201]